MDGSDWSVGSYLSYHRDAVKKKIRKILGRMACSRGPDRCDSGWRDYTTSQTEAKGCCVMKKT